MADQLPPPPRFGPSGQMPRTPIEIAQWLLWEWKLWKATKSAASIPQVQGLMRPAPANFGPNSTTLNAALMLSAARVAPQVPAQSILDRITRPSPQGPNQALETANLAAVLAMRQQQPRFGAQNPAQAGLVLEDTHANRIANYPANNYAIGTLFFETDRTILYINIGPGGSQAWRYLAGFFSCTQATLPAGLGANDNGFLANVFDYGHMLVWSGAAWTWGPGDAGSGMLQLFEVDPTAAGWHLYDGSTVNYLKADGTLGSKVLPNLSGAAPTRCYLKTSDTNAGPIAPTAPGFTGTGVGSPTFTGTPATLTGTVAAPVFTGTALGVHAHTESVGVLNATTGILTGDFGTGNTQNISKTFTIASSAGTAAFLDTSAVSAGTPAGTNSAPTLTMNSYTPAGTISGGTPTGTIDTTGEPENLTRRAWFRQ